jgi:hypothetical protein
MTITAAPIHKCHGWIQTQERFLSAQADPFAPQEPPGQAGSERERKIRPAPFGMTAAGADDGYERGRRTHALTAGKFGLG